MASTAELSILIKAQNEASKVLKTIQNDAGGLGKTLADVSKIAAGFVIGKGLLALPGLLDAPVKAASNLAESMNAVQVVFGQTSDKILQFGRVTATQVGLSQRAFNELATPLGAMLKNSGLNMDEVADKTVELTKRAADMASVFNTDVSSALGAITAGLRGEADPLERFGVKLNAAAIEAEALALGLVPAVKNTKDITAAQVAAADATQKYADAQRKNGRQSIEAQKALVTLNKAQDALEKAMRGSTGKMTDQAKAQASLSLIMKQTSAVAGDFANTSDGLANKQRILAARNEEVSAQLGQKLMPIMLKVKEVQLQLVELFTSRLLPVLTRIGQTAAPLVSAAFERVSGTASSLIATITPLVNLFKLGFDGGQIGGNFSLIERAAFTLGNTLKKTVIPAIGDAKEGIRLFLLTLQGGEVGGDIGGFAQKMADLGTGVKDAWENGLQPALTAIKDFLINDFYPVFKTGVEVEIKAFKDAFEALDGPLKSVFNFIIENKAAMVVALTAITGAFVLMTGPVGNLALAYLALTAALGAYYDALKKLEGFDSPVKGNFLKDLPIIGGTLDSALKKLPGRAAGGPVSAGQPYVVGEQGPELFVPQWSGRIHAAPVVGQSGGGGGGVSVGASAGGGGNEGQNVTVNNRNVIIQTMNVTAASPKAFTDYAMGLGR